MLALMQVSFIDIYHWTSKTSYLDSISVHVLNHCFIIWDMLCNTVKRYLERVGSVKHEWMLSMLHFLIGFLKCLVLLINILPYRKYQHIHFWFTYLSILFFYKDCIKVPLNFVNWIVLFLWVGRSAELNVIKCEIIFTFKAPIPIIDNEPLHF